MIQTTTPFRRPITTAIITLAITELLLAHVRPASAQWTANDAQRAFTAYNSAFLYTEPDGYSKVFVTEQGGTTPQGFWTFAEEIEMAEDAYYENKTSANETEVQALCDGFIYLYGDSWTSDVYNDDLDVATIAFARAYAITGTTRWLTDAENNFTAVWNRAQAGDGGLCEKTVTPVYCYQNSSVNWTFVIAGRLLTNYSGVSGYATDANSVYNNWAIPYLYDSSTGEIYDGCYSTTNCVGPDYSYNYGYAIGAMSEEGASVGTIGNVANYLFNSMSNSTYPYAGTYDGYNILPNYGQGDLNDSGFNGIACRWVGVANGHGSISSSIIDAQQANTNAAWSERNGTSELIWNDWISPTPSTGTYSWDDSAALACLMDTPPTD
jgi:Glycosyl hydrolase family 76